MSLRKRFHLRPWWLWTAAALLVSGVLAAAFMLDAVYALARDARRPVGDPPVGLGAEPVEFLTHWQLRLEGWLIDGRPGGGAVVLMHPIRADRRTMLPRARMLARAGYSVLLFDFSGHGESEGDEITFGRQESFDAEAAVRFLRVLKPDERIGAIGMSLGGAASLLGRRPLDVDALVLEAVYPDLDSAIRNRLELRFGTTGRWLDFLLSRPLVSLLELDPETLRPIDSIAEIRCPVLIASGGLDQRTTERETRELFGAAPEPKELWIVDGASHEDLYRHSPAEYETRVLGFLDRNLRH